MRKPFLSLSCSAAFLLLLNGCAAPVQAINDFIGIPVPLYYTEFSFAAEAHEQGDDMRGIEHAGFTAADAEIDGKLAGPRQGEELSLLLTAVSKFIQASDWYNTLQPGQYSPMHLTRLDSSASGLDSDEYEKQIFDNARTVELDHAFHAVHRVYLPVIRKKCKMVIKAMNDSMPGVYTFDTPEHEDIYMKRAWGAAASIMGAFRYGVTTAEQRELRRSKSISQVRDGPFVEELRGTELEPNVVAFYQHPVYEQLVQPSSTLKLLLGSTDEWAVHFVCSDEVLLEARRWYLMKNPEAAEIYRELAKSMIWILQCWIFQA